MKNFLASIVLSLLMFNVAVADVEWNAAITSEYIDRGISYGKGPAFSGGVDISSESGFWAGAWASNVDFGDNTSYELDVYVGYSLGPLSIGYIYYAYPDNTDEGYDSSEITIAFDIGSFSIGADILADADWDMDFAEEVYYSIGTSLGITNQIDISFHLGFYDYDVDDDETDYGISIDFDSGFSFGVIDSSRDDSKPFFVVTYSFNMEQLDEINKD